MLRIALEGPYVNFGNHVIEKANPLWNNETKYQFPYANPSSYMSYASSIYCSVTSVMFPNYKDVN